MYAERLTELASALGFDGWLVSFVSFLLGKKMEYVNITLLTSVRKTLNWRSFRCTVLVLLVFPLSSLTLDLLLVVEYGDQFGCRTNSYFERICQPFNQDHACLGAWIFSHMVSHTR